MAQPSTVQEAVPTLEPQPREPRLTREQGWELIFSLFGSGKEMYAKVGGAKAFLESERAAWTDDESR